MPLIGYDIDIANNYLPADKQAAEPLPRILQEFLQAVKSAFSIPADSNMLWSTKYPSPEAENPGRGGRVQFRKLISR